MVFHGILLIAVSIGIYFVLRFRMENSSPIYEFSETAITNVNRYELFFGEDIACDKKSGVFYSGLKDGSFVKVDAEKKTIEILLEASDFNPIILEIENENGMKHGELCKNSSRTIHTCGQNLGVKFDENMNLIISNKVFGIFRFNPKTRNLKKILDSNRTKDLGFMEFFDDVVPGRKEFSSSIYIAVASKFYSHKKSILSVWGLDKSGSLVEYNHINNIRKELIGGMGFPAGLCYVNDNSDNHFIFVSDFTHREIIKFDIRKNEIVGIFKIPIHPDNLSWNVDRSRIYIAGFERSKKMEILGRFFSPIIRVIGYLSPKFLRRMTLKMIRCDTGIFLEMDLEGNITGYVYSKGEHFRGANSVQRVGDFYYIGSIFHPEIVRLSIKK